MKIKKNAPVIFLLPREKVDRSNATNVKTFHDNEKLFSGKFTQRELHLFLFLFFSTSKNEESLKFANSIFYKFDVSER